MASNTANGAKRDEKGRNIQVVVRCRPFNTTERKTSHGVIDCDQNRREVTVRTGGPNDKAARKTYTFDMVFAPAAKQIDVYRSVVCPILDEVIMGYNCTVFAYGQTGTGKTFTMEGDRTPDEQFTWEEDPLAGIIPRTLHQIFEKLSENGTEFSVKVSLLEIYNEELFDLLSPGDDVNERLQLFDDPRNKRGVVVKGLEEITVHNKDEVYQILERGAAKRKTASTLMNAYSSRSHSVFSVTIHMKEITVDGEELVKIGKLNLVDLAGSENIGRSGAVDKRAREAGNINQSLLTLGRVITALVEKRPHIPYRESKLTRILQDSLGGRTKTSIIATVSPSSSNLEETLSTLEYACRAKNIMNKPEVNQKLTKRTLIKEYTEEIERLKRDLAATRDKNGVYLSAENYQSMVGQISNHEEQITEYIEKIGAMEEEIRKITELFVDSKSKLEQCTVDLEEKQQRLEETSRDLEETKEKLTQEEFICSDLAVVHQSLYNTAGQLLDTVDLSTSDVSSLHDKLDRKKQVEQHNQNIQQKFGLEMEQTFSNLQEFIQKQSSKHQELLDSYSQAIGVAVEQNDAALKASLSAMEQFVGDVEAAVGDGVKCYREKVDQLETISVRDREIFLRLLDEHQQDLEQTVNNKALLSLTAVKNLEEKLRNRFETQRELANQVEAMKQISVSFSQLQQDLTKLRENTEEEVKRLLEEQRRLEDDIQEVQDQQQKTMQSFLEQMKLLSLKSEQDFTKLRTSSRALQKPLRSIQENISSGCSAAERQILVHSDFVSSSSSSLSSSLRNNTDAGLEELKEQEENREVSHSALCALLQRDVLWASEVRKQTENTAEEQRHLLDHTVTEGQALIQSVEQISSLSSSSTADLLSAHSLKTTQSLQSLEDRSCSQKNVLQEDQEETQQLLEKTQGLVTVFLQEELQRDVSTGATPQRRDFLFPRELVKRRSRSELLEQLKEQQEALRVALEEEPEEEEEPQSQDSLEDEPSVCNESSTTEPSFIDENLVFNQSERLPFFKKKGKGKQSKLPSRSKAGETEPSPKKATSRLPLRCQN